jgi:hypothetical protein
MNAEIDVRAVLPTIQAPTLVVHRTGDRCLKVEEGRYLASRIPTATFIELAGSDHLPFVGNQDEILDEIERFLARVPAVPASEHVLATMLIVLAEGDVSREQVARLFSREVATHRGRLVHLGSAGLAAAFDGPGRAVRCGCAVITLATALHITARAGVHVGECDPGSSSGPLVAISSRIAHAAAPGELLASRTLVDLLPGSGLHFDERGSVAVDEPRRELPVLAVVSS